MCLQPLFSDVRFAEGAGLYYDSFTKSFLPKTFHVPGMFSPTPAAAMTLDITKGNFQSWTAGQNEDLDAPAGLASYGTPLTLLIINDSVARTITFSGLKANGNLVGVANKISMISFILTPYGFTEVSRVSGF